MTLRVLGLVMFIGGTTWLLAAGGWMFVKEWRNGRRQGFPRSR